MQSFIQAIGEYVVPVLQESNFPKTGKLTPKEFELAGNFLVYKCPTWKWKAAECNCREYLPRDKQYLITEAISVVRPAQNQGIVQESLPNQDASEFAIVEGQRHQESLRYYQLYITYDKYYQTPRLWLQASTADGANLTPKDVMQDVSSEYANKTVTIEYFPFRKKMLCASIHPCRHASVMRRMVANALKPNGDQEGIRVDQYLVLFLKFMSSVIPTIEYDNTMSM